MEALIWIATGLVAGWLAGLLSKGRDYGITGSILLGLLGGIVGGWVLHLVGIVAAGNLLQNALISLFGAMLVLGVERRLRAVVRRTRSVLGEGAKGADVSNQLQKLSEFERRVFERVRGRKSSVQDLNRMFEEQMTFGQRVADQVAKFGGSWTFIGLFLLFMLIWMVINTEIGGRFDPFPFILLNLILSCLAALQAPVIMMSQNRQAVKDRLDAKVDYDVNVRAEQEITRLHAKFDELREREWAELVEMQRRQIAMLEQALERLAAAH